MPSTAPRSRACGASTTCRRHPARRRSSMFEAARRRRDQGALDRVHEPGAVDARPGDGAARARARASSSSSRRRSRPPRPAPTPTCCCRRRPGARRTAPSPTASGASAASAPAVAAPGEARDDWRDRDRLRAAPRAAASPAYRARGHAVPLRQAAEAVWNEHRETTRGRDLDITGLDYAQARGGARAVAVARGRSEGRERLYADGVFADRRRPRALLRRALRAAGRGARRPLPVRAQHRPPARPVARHEPHRLDRPPVRPCARAGVDMNGEDMARLGLVDGDLASVTSRRGAIVCPAQRSAAQAPAQVFMAMHWGEEFVSGARGAGGRAERARRRQRADPAGVLPAVEAARAQACRGQGREAELPARVLALAWLRRRSRRWPCARRCDR